MEDTEKKGTKIIFPDASDADLPGVFESPMASWAQKGYQQQQWTIESHPSA